MVKDKEYKIVRLVFWAKVSFLWQLLSAKKCLASQYELLLFPHQSCLKPSNTLRDVGKVTKTLAIPHCYTFHHWQEISQNYISTWSCFNLIFLYMVLSDNHLPLQYQSYLCWNRAGFKWLHHVPPIIQQCSFERKWTFGHGRLIYPETL